MSVMPRHPLGELPSQRHAQHSNLPQVGAVKRRASIISSYTRDVRDTDAGAARPARSLLGASAASFAQPRLSTPVLSSAPPPPPPPPAMDVFNHQQETEQELFGDVFMQMLEDADAGVGHVARDHLQFQVEVTDKMRAILVDWLVDVQRKFDYTQETLHLSVNLLDRYLARKAVAKAKLQLVGCVAMFLAAKYEEKIPPQVSQFVYISANTYTRDDMLSMEKSMLVELEYCLTVPTMWPFVLRFADAQPALVASGIEYLSEQVLMTAKLASFAPHVQVAACVHLARTVLGSGGAPAWPESLERLTGLTAADIQPALSELEQYMKRAPRLRTEAVRKKYRRARYDSVSLQFDVLADA